MFIVQIVGMFEAATEIEATEEAQRLGHMLKNATDGKKGTVFAQVSQESCNPAAGLLEHVQGLVAEKAKAAN